jgi:hypothetical protein
VKILKNIDIQLLIKVAGMTAATLLFCAAIVVLIRYLEKRALLSRKEMDRIAALNIACMKDRDVQECETLVVRIGGQIDWITLEFAFRDRQDTSRTIAVGSGEQFMIDITQRLQDVGWRAIPHCNGPGFVKFMAPSQNTGEVLESRRKPSLPSIPQPRFRMPSRPTLTAVSR